MVEVKLSISMPNVIVLTKELTHRSGKLSVTRP